MFEASVTIYRKRLRTLVTTAAVLVLPYAVLYAFLAEPVPVLPSEPTVEELREILTALGPWMLIRLFIATVMFAAVIRTVVETYVGIESSWQRSTVAAINRLPALAVVTVLFWSGTILGWMFLLIPGIFLLVSWSACLPVLIVEGADPVSAMLRSWRMTSGRRWSLFGVLVVASLLVFLAGTLVYIVAGAVLVRSCRGTSGCCWRPRLHGCWSSPSSAWCLACCIWIFGYARRIWTPTGCPYSSRPPPSISRRRSAWEGVPKHPRRPDGP